MKLTELGEAMGEANRFLNTAHILMLQLRTDPERSSKENASCRRASMDLTRALAKMRQS